MAPGAFTTTGGPGGAPATEQFTPIEAAHVNLMASTNGAKPHMIVRGLKDSTDFAECSERLTAVQAYVDARFQRRGPG